MNSKHHQKILADSDNKMTIRNAKTLILNELLLKYYPNWCEIEPKISPCLNIGYQFTYYFDPQNDGAKLIVYLTYRGQIDHHVYIGDRK